MMPEYFLLVNYGKNTNSCLALVFIHLYAAPEDDVKKSLSKQGFPAGAVSEMSREGRHFLL